MAALLNAMREAQGSLRGRVDTAAGDDDSQLQDQLVDTSGRVEQPTSEDRRSRKEGKKDGRKEREQKGSDGEWQLLDTPHGQCTSLSYLDGAGCELVIMMRTNDKG